MPKGGEKPFGKNMVGEDLEEGRPREEKHRDRKKLRCGEDWRKKTEGKTPGEKMSNTAQWHLYSLFQEVPTCMLREFWRCIFLFLFKSTPALEKTPYYTK